MLSVVYCDVCLSCQMIKKAGTTSYGLLNHDCFNVLADIDLIAFIPA